MTPFDAVYAAESRHVLALAHRLMRDRALAEDVAQEAWLKVATHLHTFNGTAKVSTWIYSIVFNTAMSMKRTRACRTPPVAIPEGFDIVADAPSPLEAVIGRDEVQRMRRTIARLPPIHRDVLELWMSGVSTKDGAFLLGVREQAFKSRANRARAAFMARWT